MLHSTKKQTNTNSLFTLPQNPMEKQEKYCKNNKNQLVKKSTKVYSSTNNDDDDTIIRNRNTKNGAKQVKLAALAIRLNAKLRSADMPLNMQERALCFTKSFLDAALAVNTTRLKPCQLAAALKKEFDTRYGAAWHCVVGTSFGSYVTHTTEGFLYFSFDSLFVLLFQTRVHLLIQP